MELDGGDTMEVDGAATGHAQAGGGGCGGGGGSLAGDQDDRLSALPDSLLHAILSFLKARQAVQTCVLATRWRHLWCSVPSLDVDQDEFRAAPPKRSNNHNHHPAPVIDNHFIDDHAYIEDEDEEEEEGNDDAKDNEWDNFEDFADCLMHHCNIAQLDSLRLRVSKSRAPSFADKQAGGWLRRAMKYCTSGPSPSRQREGLGSTNSWHLRRLYLCNVALDCRFTMHVSAVCRSLEDLELEDCMCMIHVITSNSLKSLVLKNCRWNYLSEIAVPKLKSLAITGGSNSSDCAGYQGPRHCSSVPRCSSSLRQTCGSKLEVSGLGNRDASKSAHLSMLLY